MADRTLYLIRHAHTQQTALPAETWPLSELGRQQAHKLAERPFWHEVHIICTSVEPKALQTAQVVAERHDLPVEPSFDLRELRRPGDFVSDYKAAVREVLANPTTSVNGWEPAGEAQTRVMTAIERLLMLHENTRGRLARSGAHALPGIPDRHSTHARLVARFFVCICHPGRSRCASDSCPF